MDIANHLVPRGYPTPEIPPLNLKNQLVWGAILLFAGYAAGRGFAFGQIFAPALITVAGACYALTGARHGRRMSREIVQKWRDTLPSGHLKIGVAARGGLCRRIERRIAAIYWACALWFPAGIVAGWLVVKLR